MRDNEQLLRGILENLSDVAYRHDLSLGRYDYLTASIEAITGYTPEEVNRGGLAGVLERIHPDDRAAVSLAVAAAGETGQGAVEYRFRHRDGGYRWLADNFMVQRDPDGQPRHLVGVARDITERKHAEQALRCQHDQLQRMNAELEEFAYVASHDLKAPLRAVANLAAWIDEDASEAALGEENRARLHLMRERIVRMDGLINGLLEYARLGTAATGGHAPVPLSEVIGQIRGELPRPPGFSLESEGALPSLRADPIHLRQVFQNLIANALDHHDRDHGRVVVRARAEGASWRIEVADDGPGIPSEARSRMFRMFNTTSRGHSGIGLAVVRKLVVAYGGRIEVADNEPRGSVFVILWPTRPADGQA